MDATRRKSKVSGSTANLGETYETFKKRLIYSYKTRQSRLPFKSSKHLTRHDCNLPKFYKLLLSHDDKSAEISFILRKFKLWNDENFWNEIDLLELMSFYAIDDESEAKVKNLFSILMFDWNESWQFHGGYFLKMKFNAFGGNWTLFEKLYEIINNERFRSYHHVCLKIIYHYLYEIEKYEGEWSEEFNLTRLGSIDSVLSRNMRNYYYQIEILKILVVHWNVDYWRISSNHHLTSHNRKKHEYECYKILIMNLFARQSVEPPSLYLWPQNFQLECNKFFFKLAFYLKEMLPKKFESEFERYVKYYQEGYGEYWKISIRPDVHLLLRIADGLDFYKTVEFMFKQCPFIALNWNILMSFEDIGEFYEILNRPLKRKEAIKMNFIKREFQRIDDAVSQTQKFQYTPKVIGDEIYSINSSNSSFSIRPDEQEDEKFLSVHQSIDSFESANNVQIDIEMKNFNHSENDRFYDCDSNFMVTSQRGTKMKTMILKKYLRNCREDRRLLFGRRRSSEVSLFEDILRSSGGSSFVNYVWNEFRLWENAEILTMVNPLGKTLMHYIVESNDDLNLMTFLMPKVVHLVEFKRHKHYMKVLNNLYYSITNKTLLEFYLEVSMDDRSIECDQEDYQVILCKHIIHLLEEIGTIQKVQQDPLIDKLIRLCEADDFYDSIVRPNSKYKIQSKSEKLREKFHIDDLLGRMIVYWKPNSDEKLKGNFYPAYKRRLTKISPFFELLFNLIEYRSKSFKSSFRSKIHKLEQSYEKRYKDIGNSEYHTSSLTFVMLLAAIQTNQKNVINFIFDQDIFETVKFDFPSNMKVGEIHHYTALMLLKNGHELGKAVIPEEWITPAVLYEFLDSQVMYHNQELIEIDCSCMLHSETRKTVVKCPEDVTEKMMLWDDDRTLHYILKHKNISSVISHPVVSTFIELKYSKYKMLFRINFWFFLFLFVIPFSLFIFYESNEISLKLYVSCILSITAFSIKEFVQYRIAKSSMNYLKDLTNKIDIPLLFLSCFLLAAFAFNWPPEVQSLLEVFFIFVMTWDAMTMLPIEDVSRTLQIIKKVIMTFVKVFCSFALIILAFAFSFRILFGADYLGPRNSTIDETEREPNMRNFEGIITTFVKVLVMMAGEYTIEPSKLKWYQLALFGIFVVFSFILFNLLLGMSIEDIQNLREDSLQRDLERKAKKFIETNDKFEEIYAERTFENSNKISITNRIIYKLSKFFLSEYVYLHNFRKVYVNIVTKEVTVSVNGKQERVARRKINYLSRKFYIHDEIFDKIEDIISIRDQENCLNVVKRH